MAFKSDDCRYYSISLSLLPPVIFPRVQHTGTLGPALTWASVEPSKMKREVLTLLCLLVTTATASPDGKYWWMGSGDAFGDSQQDNQVSRMYES